MWYCIPNKRKRKSLKGVLLSTGDEELNLLPYNRYKALADMCSNFGQHSSNCLEGVTWQTDRQTGRHYFYIFARYLWSKPYDFDKTLDRSVDNLATLKHVRRQTSHPCLSLKMESQRCVFVSIHPACTSFVFPPTKYNDARHQEWRLTFAVLGI